MTVISYPIPAYANVPIQPQFYQPRRFEIEDIVRGQTTTVTTIENTDYVVGQLVRLIIPPSFGIRQLNEQEAFVIQIVSADILILNINSSQMDPFATSSATTRPQILAIGDGNSGAINSSGRTNNTTFIQGSFINISPQ